MIESECGYFCYIEGLGVPVAHHKTFERALTEANRLSGMEPRRNVYVVGSVHKLASNGEPLDAPVRGRAREVNIRIKKKRLLEISR